jgi:hypothetical protein
MPAIVFGSSQSRTWLIPARAFADFAASEIKAFRALVTG